MMICNNGTIFRRNFRVATPRQEKCAGHHHHGHKYAHTPFFQEARRVYNQLHPVLGSFDRAMQAICSAPPACTCLQINVTPQSQTSGDEHRHYEN
jgi:hypothetical protein